MEKLNLKKDLCGECGGCVAVCAFEALDLESQGLKIKEEFCVLCNDCVVFCSSGALEITDKE
jgi:heterodisulfide reductase subunit A-like polyferredoxin